MGFVQNIIANWCHEHSAVVADKRPTVAAGTHIGRVRRLNEDSYATVKLPGAHEVLAAVADGVGGEQAGEVASWFAITYLLRERHKYALGAVDNPKTARNMLVDGLHAANTALDQINSKLGGANFAMGTTVAAAVFVPGAVVIAHAGDSRCYRLRNGTLAQITSDHTWAQNLVEIGELKNSDVTGHPWEHTLSNCLGILPQVELAVETHELRCGDRFLLCTDGVTQMLPEEEISRLLSKASHPGRAVRDMTRASLRHGGIDNIALAAAFA
ncbi:MAG: protein phosphatase 2C domain-containing protein [Lentisphaeria bacterium]